MNVKIETLNSVGFMKYLEVFQYMFSLFCLILDKAGISFFAHWHVCQKLRMFYPVHPLR